MRRALLALYSVGNIVIAVGTLTGLLEPSAAWEASGGVTGRSVGYLFFFLVAAPLFGALAVSYQRRVRPGRAAVVAGVAGAPLLLGSVLVAVPALLAAMDRMP